jgi:hypothetical protein
MGDEMRLLLADLCMLTAILMVIMFFAGVSGVGIDKQHRKSATSKSIYEQNEAYLKAHPKLKELVK